LAESGPDLPGLSPTPVAEDDLSAEVQDGLGSPTAWTDRLFTALASDGLEGSLGGDAAADVTV